MFYAVIHCSSGVEDSVAKVGQANEVTSLLGAGSCKPKSLAGTIFQLTLDPQNHAYHEDPRLVYCCFYFVDGHRFDALPHSFCDLLGWFDPHQQGGSQGG
jgi:hypothetical protein